MAKDVFDLASEFLAAEKARAAASEQLELVQAQIEQHTADRDSAMNDLVEASDEGETFYEVEAGIVRVKKGEEGNGAGPIVVKKRPKPEAGEKKKAAVKTPPPDQEGNE